MINKVEKVIEVTVERMASVCCHHKPSNKLCQAIKDSDTIDPGTEIMLVFINLGREVVTKRLLQY